MMGVTKSFDGSHEKGSTHRYTCCPGKELPLSLLSGRGLLQRLRPRVFYGCCFL